MSIDENGATVQTGRHAGLSTYEKLATTAMVACLFAFVDSAIAQAQMLLLDGQILTNKIAKVIFVTALTFGILLRPKVNISGVPVVAWLVALSYLLFEIVYMQAARDISPGDILQTYNAIYAYLLLSPAALAFHDTVPERFVIRGIVCAFVICAIIGTAQYLTLDPLLHLCDIDEDYTVQSVWFFDQIRAFSLFSSPLNYGIFCSFCGALGIGLSREKRVQGVLLATLSAAACYTTLTRNCYLIFFAASTYALVITFGKSPKRGLVQPTLYFMLAVLVIIYGVRSFDGDLVTDVQSTSSLFERLASWNYYSRVLARSSLAQVLFGHGVCQSNKLSEALPVPIDNVFLAVILHVGIVGLIAICTLMVRMWLYVRREAVTYRQPLLIAAASLWATLICEGTFAIVLCPYGIALALAILCKRRVLSVLA